MTEIRNDFEARMPQDWKWKEMTFFVETILWKIKIDPFDDEDMSWKWSMVGDCWQVDLST